MAWASAYSELGQAYRAVGDLGRARQAFEDGLAFAQKNLSGLREEQVEGNLLNNLASIAHRQKDYQTALARNTEAAQFFESWEARVGAKMVDRQRATVRRLVATSYFGIGRDLQALGRLDEADAAYTKALAYARASGLRQPEVQMLAAQGNLALARKDWAKALALYQQSLALANQSQVRTNRAGLYQGQSRALEGLGRLDEALASIQEAIRQIEVIRADLTDPSLRSGFFDDKLGLYQHAVYWRSMPSGRKRRSPSRSGAGRGPSSTSSAARPRCPKGTRARWSTRRCGSGRGSSRPGRQRSRPKGPRNQSRPRREPRRSTRTTRRSSNTSGRKISSRPRSWRWSR